MSDEDWLFVLDVNLNGVFWCARAFGRSMIAAKSGVIVNIGSMSGDIVNRPQEQAQYNASKAGVQHLTRSLAVECAPHGVRVNAVAPSYIDTELLSFAKDNPALMASWVGGTPMNRMGWPEEIASVVQFLASDASSLMTGAIVVADGGYTLW
jgi:NAD(P)-dependent dehydrogenase (short-subunit alcohol dehydrogenase family)